MKLQPVIYRKVSQKKKNKYHKLIHNVESRKMILMNLFTGKEWRSRFSKQTCDTAGEGEGGTYVE